jgi:CheY-like chemotaxis protein
MPKRVLDVGQCGPDHATISSYLKKNFGCDVGSADGAIDTLDQLKNGQFDLVLVNRKLDADYSDGIEVIKQIKAEASLSRIPVMLVTNYPEHQEAAVAVGAIRGFGKLEFNNPDTRARLEEVLSK